MRAVVRWVTLPSAAVLVVFNLRRLLFTLVALTGRAGRGQHLPTEAGVPTVHVLVPCRNESATLPGLVESLSRLEYPADRLRVTLIDDGSTDKSRALMGLAAENRAGWRVIHHAVNRGKARALNDALAHIGFGEVMVVYDADHRPEPDSLRRLVAVFEDPSVAGASGRTIPLNPTASLPAYYAAVESLVHQTITMRAKDRLNLAPALLGSNCAYRRRALEQAGGFKPGALLEDSDLTLAFARLGYRLRCVPESIAQHQVPETIDGYLRQHLRWARGFNDVARDHAAAVLADRRLPLRLRIELTLFSVGYLDRLALLAAMGIRVFARAGSSLDGRLRAKDDVMGGVLKLALLMPLAQIAAAFAAERAPRRMWARFPAIPFLFGLDVLVAVRAAIDSVLNRPRLWTKTARINESSIRSLKLNE